METSVDILGKAEADELREQVRERYSKSAIRVQSGGGEGCCGSAAGSGCCSGEGGDPITAGLYSGEEAAEVPTEALLASLGCGNPTALARLNKGETVLDLGSGGGIDVLLSAKRVGPTGFAYGLDMTDEMLALAEANKRKAGVENVRFLKGYIERIPLPDNAVDVVISNCVINLAADKRPVLQEAFRVLKPGGRFAVSDVVRTGDAPERVLRSMEAWTGCIAGALHKAVYESLLAEVGFTDVGIEITRSYAASDIEDTRQAADAAPRSDASGYSSPTSLMAEDSVDTGTAADASHGGCCSPSALTGDELSMTDGLFAGAFIRATKPV
ncbi:MAG: arsenite methyltransferase [Chloroflexota bacterium]|nr:arsenite methyltransferase [Chloroflexota bacterium]